MTRLKEKYRKEVVPALQKEFGYTNVIAVPKIEKVVVNMGLGEATANAKLIDTGADELARITGQKPVTRRAKKSIAAFKVRRGMPMELRVEMPSARRLMMRGAHQRTHLVVHDEIRRHVGRGPVGPLSADARPQSRRTL